MFAPPGGGPSAQRPISSPAPWQETEQGDSGSLEHHRLGADTGGESPFGQSERPISDPGARPSFLADESPGADSGFYDQEQATESGTISSDSLDGLPDTPSELDADTPAPLPSPVALPKREHRSLCKICFGPAASALTDICNECRDRAGTPLDDASGVRRVRPKIRPQKTSVLRRAVAAVFWGGLLVAAGFGVVKYRDVPTPGGGLLTNVVAEAAVIRLVVPVDGATDFVTMFDVRIERGQRDSQFADDLSTVFDLQQRSRNLSRVTLVNTLPGAAILNVHTESILDAQEGEYVTEVGAQTAYPWGGQVRDTRVRVPLRGRIQVDGGGLPYPARDVPPFVVFGTVGAPDGNLEPGATWRSEVSLPCIARPGGAIAAHPFVGEFEFVGRRVVNGRACAIVSVEATPVAGLGAGFEKLENAAGKVAGALAFDVGSGLLVSAELVVDTVLTRGSVADPDERIAMTGALSISRSARAP